MIPAGCLRIFGAGVSASQQRLSQIIDTYLAHNWTPPRRFAQITACAFLLTDPAAARIDVGPLAGSATALQRELGTAGPSLLLFEGSLAAVETFAGLDEGAVAEGLRDPSRLPGGGRLTQIADLTPPPAAPPVASPAAAAGTPTFAGVYSLSRQGFVGDVLGRSQGDRSLGLTTAVAPQGQDMAAFDLAGLEEGARRLATPGYVGVLFFPVAFSALASTELGPAYLQALKALPADRRNQLAAEVYDLPNQPSARALQWLSATLAPHVSYIDLRLTDADFPVTNIKAGSLSGGTLVLPDGAPELRRAVVSRWMTSRTEWKERRLLTSLSNLRTADEIRTAGVLQIPFVSGPAVSAVAATPFGGTSRPVSGLPA
ncbi:MAG TPA: hypothetical protein PK913_02550 [Phenylobacterium sp.]|nr:hypothetical protein [Phenylobacterium sp.]